VLLRDLSSSVLKTPRDEDEAQLFGLPVPLLQSPRGGELLLASSQKPPLLELTSVVKLSVNFKHL